ncbi:hypothetical protein EDD22DRAFT_850615 [Suillus occidentalis]|nr:hypothetical protein EDD22DRAFT_850615 [Suillus occidentalis]
MLSREMQPRRPKRKKKELLKKIENETEVKPREYGIMNHYFKYLMEMVNSLTEKEIEQATKMALKWNKQGVPLKVQADIARWKSDNTLMYVTKKMFKMANSDNADNLVVKKGRKNNMYTLEMGNNRYSILPDHAKMDSDTQKAVVQAFLNWYYYKSVKVDNEVKPHTSNLDDKASVPKPELKSKSWVGADDLKDKFNAPDSSEAPLDEDMSDSEKKTQPIKQTAVYEKKKLAHPNKLSIAQVQFNTSDRQTQKSRTSISYHYCIMHYTRSKEDAQQGSFTKCAQTEVKSKKRSAEHQLQELLAKRTRSKMAKVP